MPHDSSESQSPKEIRISFGDLHKKVYRACAAANLSGIESNLLQAMIGHLDRSSYKANLSDILTHKREYWADMMGIEGRSITRVMNTLVETGFLERIKNSTRVFYRLSSYFVAYVLCPTEHAFLPFMSTKGHKSVTLKAKVTSLTPNRSQDCDSLGHKSVTLPLYIEDSLSSIPSLYSPQKPKSTEPSGSAGGKVTLRELMGRLQNIYAMMSPYEAEAVIKAALRKDYTGHHLIAVFDLWDEQRAESYKAGRRIKPDKSLALPNLFAALANLEKAACTTAKE